MEQPATQQQANLEAAKQRQSQQDQLAAYQARIRAANKLPKFEL